MPTQLHVPFSEKNLAKSLGARWDGQDRVWFVPDGLDLAPFARWIPSHGETPKHQRMTPGEEPSHLSLSAYLGRVEHLVRTQLSTPTWIVAETAQCSLRGNHLYIDLTEVDGAGQVIAQTRANAFNCTGRTWYRSFVDAVGGPPAPGMKLLLQVSCSYSTRYGLALTIHAIDASFSVGEFARKVQHIVRTLEAEGILRQQDRHPTPKDFTRIALVAPAQAAGLGDVMADADRLQRAGLIEVVTFTAVFQGDAADGSLTAALQRVEQAHALEPFDVCIVLRGGGSALDLDGCNAINACRQIARLSLPVFSAIGHERDHVALDEVAARSFDTPSKAIAHVRTTILERASAAMKTLEAITTRAEHRLIAHELHISGRHIWWRAEPKHADGDAVESHMVSIVTLREAFDSDSETIYLRNGDIDPTLALDLAEATA